MISLLISYIRKLTGFSSVFVSRATVIFGLSLYSASALCCTSAIVSAKASASGRPLLWKNRDTSNFDNKISYIPASEVGELAYVALFNASDRDCAEAWAGMNEAGLAIMNTASYNLKNDRVPAKEMDREGLIMTLALKHCRTVEDFDNLLRSLPRPLGVEANFGVIDASGEGAYFETDNNSFVRFDVADAPAGVLVRTNYSHSGRKGEGYGQIREQNALHLLAPHINARTITPELFTEGLSCSFYHSLYGRDMLADDTEWLIDQDFIPRYTSTASIVIEGVEPADELTGKEGGQYVMWTKLGYPPCAEVTPVRCAPDGVIAELQGIDTDGTAPLCNRALARKREVFSAPDGNSARYIRKDALISPQGTGYLSRLRQLNHATYEHYHR